MAKIRLKVCGLRDNIQKVASLQPDYAGFIFYPKSPRYVGEHFQMPYLDKLIKKVGVFVNESVEIVLEKARKYDLQFIQLHGNESVTVCETIRQSEIALIKAFPIDDDFDFSRLEPYENVVDYFLFDTKTKGYGGSGKTFNWEILVKYKLEKPYFLSGGLSLSNLSNLNEIYLNKVHALDVNSMFEVKPGLKDLGMLRSLSARIKELNQYLATSS